MWCGRGWYLIDVSVASERHAEHEADAVLVGCGQFVVVQSAHVLHVENLEDVVNAGHDFHIGLFRVHDVAASGEVHQQGRALVLLEEGVVLVGEVAPEGLHADVLAPLQLLEQGNAVEDLTVEVPRHVERCEAVVEELHVVDEVEGLVLYNIREVGGGHDEQGVGHLVPLYAALQVAVDLSPGVHPEALVDAELGEVVAVVAAEESLQTQGVAEGEDGSVEVDGQSALLGVDVGAARGKLQFGMQLGGSNLAVVQVAVEVVLGNVDVAVRLREGCEEQGAGGLVLFGLQRDGGLESPFLLALEGELLAVVEHHLVDGGPLEGGEDVVLVGMHELVAGRGDVVGGGEGERALGELARQVFLLVERIRQITFVINLLRVETIGHVARGEEVGREVGGGLSGESEAVAVDEVAGDDGVDGSDVELRGVAGRAGLDEVLGQGLHAEEHVLEALELFNLVDEGIHGRLALREFHGAVLVPKGFVAHHGVGVASLLGLALEELLGQRVEGIVGESGGADDDGLGDELRNLQLDDHVVDGERPFAVGQSLVFLLHLQVFDEVHVGTLRDGEVAALHVESGVGDDEELAAESKVLLVVGNELQVVAEVAVDVDGVLDVEAVEGDGILADGRGEGVLQQSHLVVVDVDIGEDVLHGDVEDVAGLNEVIDARGVDTAYDVLLVVRVAAVDVLRDGLVDGDGQDELVVVGAGLHLVEQPLALADETAVDEFVGADVVHGQRDFLILVVLIVVVVLQVGLLLGCDDAAHELNGGIVLA